MKNPVKKPLERVRKAARNAKERVKEARLDTGDDSTPLDDRTREQLYNRARQLDIEGRSGMSKRQLVAAIRRKQ